MGRLTLDLPTALGADGTGARAETVSGRTGDRATATFLDWFDSWAGN